MKKILIIIILAIGISSCTKSNNFVGSWVCDFKSKSNCGIIFKSMGGDNLKITTIGNNGGHFSMVGTVNKSGAFVANGWKFYINKNTNELIPPSGGDWDRCCSTFIKQK